MLGDEKAPGTTSMSTFMVWRRCASTTRWWFVAGVLVNNCVQWFQQFFTYTHARPSDGSDAVGRSLPARGKGLIICFSRGVPGAGGGG